MMENYPNDVRHLLFYTTPGQIFLVGLIMYWFIQYKLIEASASERKQK